jgi:hypothetical protein
MLILGTVPEDNRRAQASKLLDEESSNAVREVRLRDSASRDSAYQYVRDSLPKMRATFSPSKGAKTV